LRLKIEFSTLSCSIEAETEMWSEMFIHQSAFNLINEVRIATAALDDIGHCVTRRRFLFALLLNTARKFALLFLHFAARCTFSETQIFVGSRSSSASCLQIRLTRALSRGRAYQASAKWETISLWMRIFSGVWMVIGAIGSCFSLES